MRMEWLANTIYMATALAIFGWTLADPAVAPGHFAKPMLDYTLVALAMWAVGAIALISLGVIRGALQKTGGARFQFVLDWRAHHWREGRFAHVLIPMLAFIVTMSSFTVYKAVVLPSLGYSWDGAFIALDRWLFLGTDPWRVTHGLFSSATATYVIDKAYHAWFYPMFLAYVFCAMMIRGPLLRACYIATYLISWLVIGCVLAAEFISAGPAFDGLLFESGGTYADLMTRLGAQADAVGGLDSRFLQQTLYDGYVAGTAAFGFGISAMPSMHIALAAMWAMVFFDLNRWLGLFGVVYTAFIWMGSIHLGWHYAADGLFSSALVVAIWFAVRAVLMRFALSPVARPEAMAGAMSATPAE